MRVNQHSGLLFKSWKVPKNPCLGAVASGAATSAFIPHTTVLFPTLTVADPVARVIGAAVRFLNTQMDNWLARLKQVPPIRSDLLGSKSAQIFQGLDLLECVCIKNEFCSFGHSVVQF